MSSHIKRRNTKRTALSIALLQDKEAKFVRRTCGIFLLTIYMKKQEQDPGQSIDGRTANKRCAELQLIFLRESEGRRHYKTSQK